VESICSTESAASPSDERILTYSWLKRSGQAGS
jgi:hypothetical protein